MRLLAKPSNRNAKMLETVNPYLDSSAWVTPKASVPLLKMTMYAAEPQDDGPSRGAGDAHGGGDCPLATDAPPSREKSKVRNNKCRCMAF